MAVARRSRKGNADVSYANDKTRGDTLVLHPGQLKIGFSSPYSTTLHQIEGTAILTLFEGRRQVREVSLTPGKPLTVPPRRPYMLANNGSGYSTTAWVVSDYLKRVGADRGKILWRATDYLKRVLVARRGKKT